MKILFDASSLLNLANGEVLETVVALPQLRGRVGPLVLGECESIRARLAALIDNRSLELLRDDDLPAARFLALLERYGLGGGETECLAFALGDSDLVCCDDRRARSMLSEELGGGRVIGTLALMIRAVRDQALNLKSGLGAYQLMRRRGGFLPDLTLVEFEAAVASEIAAQVK